MKHLLFSSVLEVATRNRATYERGVHVDWGGQGRGKGEKERGKETGIEPTEGEEEEDDDDTGKNTAVAHLALRGSI